MRFCKKIIRRKKRLWTLFVSVSLSLCVLSLVRISFFGMADITLYQCTSYSRDLPTACEEETYTFHCDENTKTIFDDTELFRQCKALPFYKTGDAVTDPMVENYPAGEAPNSSYIPTKCRFALPELVSFSQPPPRPERDGYKVPNLVHYIWFTNRRQFSFITYLSFVSANRFLEPNRILIHGDVLPAGEWWQRMVREVPNVYFVYRQRPLRIQRERPGCVEHEADIVRLQAIYAKGGIYIDTDVLVLKSFDDLRNYELTLGQEHDNVYSNGVIVAQPQSPFVCVWLSAYRQYRYSADDWGTFSVRYPFFLAKLLPEHIHVEKETITRPNMLEAHDKVFNGYFDWSRNYVIHIWHRRLKDDKKRIPNGPEDIERGGNSLNEIIAYLLNKGGRVRDVESNSVL